MPDTPGQRFYNRFCGSEVSDAARGFIMLNPAVKERWERIALEWEALEMVLHQAALIDPTTAPTPTLAVQFGILQARVSNAHKILERGEIRPEWRQRSRASSSLASRTVPTTP